MNLDHNPAMILAIAALVGACFGSFITLVSYRLPRGESVVFARSRCPSCGIYLRVADLFPILSYLFSRARCRHCHLRISPRYMLTELACAVAAAYCVWRFGLSAQMVVLSLFSFGLVALIVTDLEHFLILDEYQIALLLLGIAHRFVSQGDWLDAASGFAAALSFACLLRYGFVALRKKEGLGMGDVKFFAVAGWWLGLTPLVPFVFYAGILGVVTAMVWRLISPDERFPFGPALALSLFICVLFPALPAAFWDLGSLTHPR